MSLKGTPYYGMALDAGAAKGDEAEQMAQMIVADQRRQEEEHQLEARLEAEQQVYFEYQLEQEKGKAEEDGKQKSL